MLNCMFLFTGATHDQLTAREGPILSQDGDNCVESACYPCLSRFPPTVLNTPFERENSNIIETFLIKY